jgi:hypothetical protein
MHNSWSEYWFVSKLSRDKSHLNWNLRKRKANEEPSMMSAWKNSPIFFDVELIFLLKQTSSALKWLWNWTVRLTGNISWFAERVWKEWEERIRKLRRETKLKSEKYEKMLKSFNWNARKSTTSQSFHQTNHF